MSRKVLIVEDERLISYLMETYINGSGCSTVIGSVDNGDDAIELAISEIPDLILMDIRIDGDKDGIETAEIINEHRNIPIIYTSGNSDEKTTARANRTNMIGFLTKPIDREELIELVCRISSANP